MYNNCKIRHRQMSPDLYPEVVGFIKRHYKSMTPNPNWLIDRLEFTITVSAHMTGTDDAYFEAHNRIWFADGEMIAMVNTEGELGGEAFFQVATYDLPIQVLEEMFDFVESDLMLEIDGVPQVTLRLGDRFSQAIQMAENRGFLLGDWQETTSGMQIPKKKEVLLPEGYEIVTRNQITSAARALAHQEAFGYVGSESLMNQCANGFDAMSLQPDYKESLDLFVLNPQGNVAAFGNVWYDDVNQIGILEPVGTIHSEQRKGLGKAVIHEGINRLIDLGGTYIFVGSDQKFYQRLGFDPVCVHQVFRKKSTV